MIPEENRSSLDRFRKRPEGLRRAVERAGRLTAWPNFAGPGSSPITIAGPTWLDGPRASPSTPSSPPRPASPNALTGGARSSKPPFAAPEASVRSARFRRLSDAGLRRLESVGGGRKRGGEWDPLLCRVNRLSARAYFEQPCHSQLL